MPILRLFLVAFLMSTTIWSARSANAATPYQGVYVVIDPYLQTQITLLKTAAQTSCAQNQQTLTTPFCGAASGILLRLAWCDFQLYHLNNAQNQPYPGCHYTVGYTGAVGSLGQEIPRGDLTSPCPGTYDVCAGRVRSVLGTTLQYITQINMQRSNANLPPLQLSVGMFAGIGTPQAILDAVGYVDVPNSSSPTDPTQAQCTRLPLSWKSQFISAYEQATDQLVAYIQAQMPQGANIVILKAAGITATDLEVEMPGAATLYKAPVDPGPGGPGAVLSCTSTATGAQVWLDAYNKNPIVNQNFSQAVESAFANVIGHDLGLLANAGLPNVLLSVATTNGAAFAAVNCGVTGAGTCSVTPASAGNWSTYYLEHYLDDLFDGGLAYTQAAAAYAAIRNDTFSLAPSEISVNSTALSPTPIVASQQVSCTINNTVPARAPVVVLNSSRIQVLGAGTVVGWQTATNQGSECVDSTYMQALNNGISQGGMFTEVQTDAAFTNLSQCNGALTTALQETMQLSPPTSCAY